MEQLILLHGALGSADQWKDIISLLEKEYEVHTLTLPGHNKSDAGAAFDISSSSAFLKNYLDLKQISKAWVAGYSMGGYISVAFALQYPERVKGVYTLATKYHWDIETARKETKKMNPALMAEKVPDYCKKLELQYGEQWQKVVHQTAVFMELLGKEQYLDPAKVGDMKSSVYVSVGDRDKMVSLEESAAFYKAIPHGSLSVLPHTPHLLEMMDLELVAAEIKYFIENAR